MEPKRRWKMQFDHTGDVLRAELLDGPPLEDGECLYVVEERPKRHGWGEDTAPSAGSGPPDPKLTPQPGLAHWVNEDAPLPATNADSQQAERVLVHAN